MRQLDINDKVNSRAKTVVVQFGEGGFLRAFADHMIDIANEKGVFSGGVAIIKPIRRGNLDAFNRQDSAYTVILRGLQNGTKFVERRIISAVNQCIDPFTDYDAFMRLAENPDLRFIISNTTEAGIVFSETDKYETKPADSFPGKLTQFLYARYKHFSGDNERGFIILPTELIEQNGAKLKECVSKLLDLWGMESGFKAWLDAACIFCSCLVDRLVSGYPAAEIGELEAELGYRDDLLVVGETFGLWVIESDRCEEVARAFPLAEAGMPLVFTKNLRPYHERKVRILNGTHTSMVLAAYLSGLDTVGEAISSKTMRPFIERCIHDEIAPTVPLVAREVLAFADSVLERFANPFLRHELLSISLNSVSKWRTRVLPSLKDNLTARGILPPCLTFSLAVLAAFYRSSIRGDACLIGKRGDDTYPIRDDADVLDFFAANAAAPAAELVYALLSSKAFWGEDLTLLRDMTARVTAYLEDIERHGITQAISRVMGDRA